MTALPYLQFVVLVAVGLLAGVHVAGVAGLNPALRSLPVGEYVLTKQALDRSMPRIAKPLMMGALVGSAALTGLAFAVGEARTVVLAAISTVAVVAALVAVLRGDLPINHQMASWSADDPPEDWRQLVDQWERFFAVRTVAVVTAFVCSVLAVLLG